MVSNRLQKASARRKGPRGSEIEPTGGEETKLEEITAKLDKTSKGALLSDLSLSRTHFPTSVPTLYHDDDLR